MYSLENIILLITVILNLYLGFLIYIKGRKSISNRTYFVVILSVALWSFGMILFRVLDVYIKVIPGKSLYISAGLIVASFLYFSYIYPSRNIKRNIITEAIIIMPALVIFYLVSVTSTIVKDVIVVDNEPRLVFGGLYWLYGIYIVSYFTIGFYFLFSKFLKSKGIQRFQLRYMLAGTVISSVAGTFTNLILPGIGYFKIFWLGPVFTLIMVFFISYAIVKHRLMNVRLAITRSFLFSILVIIVSGVFTASLLFATRFVKSSDTRIIVIVNVGVAIIVVLFLNPLRKFLANITDKVFFKGQVDYQDVANSLSNIISTTLERDQLLNRFTAGLKSELKLKKVDILFCDEGDKVCRLYYSHKRGRFINSDTYLKSKHNLSISKHLYNEYTGILKFFSHYQDIKVREEEERKLEDFKEGVYKRRLKNVIEDLGRRNVAVVVPVVNKNQELLIFIGDKQSGDIFDDRDIRLFDLLRSQLVSAIEKSKLYEEVKDFNLKLKERIDDATKELREANERLRQLDKAKTLFLSVASHQLRTPLSGIKGFLSMILEGDFGRVPSEIRSTLEEVYANTNRLIRLVNTFLNVSRIEAGRLSVLKMENDVVPMAKKIVKELQFPAKDKGLKLKLECNKDKIIGDLDIDKVEDVLQNLVDNAIKYTADGYVAVRVSDRGDVIRFEVEDTGQGLKKSEIKSLFNKFVRGPRSFRMHTDGSGLGLYIAKRVVEMHKGSIGVKSDGVGKGSTFWFEIPK